METGMSHERTELDKLQARCNHFGTIIQFFEGKIRYNGVGG